MKVCELEECEKEVTGYQYGSDDLKRFCCKQHQQKACARRYRDTLGQRKTYWRAECERLRKILHENGLSA